MQSPPDRLDCASFVKSPLSRQVGVSSLFRRVEITKSYALVSNGYTRSPPTIFLSLGDSNISGLAISPCSMSILGIKKWRSRAKVGESVIGPNSVDMVYLTRNESVQVKPYDAVNFPASREDKCLKVSVRINGPAHRPRLRKMIALSVGNDSSIGIVVKKLARFCLGESSFSHCYSLQLRTQNV